MVHIKIFLSRLNIKTVKNVLKMHLVTIGNTWKKGEKSTMVYGKRCKNISMLIFQLISIKKCTKLFLTFWWVNSVGARKQTPNLVNNSRHCVLWFQRKIRSCPHLFTMSKTKKMLLQQPQSSKKTCSAAVPSSFYILHISKIRLTWVWVARKKITHS